MLILSYLNTLLLILIHLHDLSKMLKNISFSYHYSIIPLILYSITRTQIKINYNLKIMLNLSLKLVI